MDELVYGDNQTSEVGGVTISYQGDGAKTAAETLYDRLQASGLVVPPVARIEQTDARLGAAEIMLSVVVTVAAKAAINTGLKYLEEYLRERVEKNETDLNLRVEVKTPTTDGRLFPFSLRRASIETVVSFLEKLREVVSDL